MQGRHQRERMGMNLLLSHGLKHPELRHLKHMSRDRRRDRRLVHRRNTSHTSQLSQSSHRAHIRIPNTQPIHRHAKAQTHPETSISQLLARSAPFRKRVGEVLFAQVRLEEELAHLNDDVELACRA